VRQVLEIKLKEISTNFDYAPKLLSDMPDAA